MTDIPDIHGRGKPQLHRTGLLYITIISSAQTDAACLCRDTCSGSRCVEGSVLCMMGQLKSPRHKGHHLRTLNQTYPRALFKIRIDLDPPIIISIIYIFLPV